MKRIVLAILLSSVFCVLNAQMKRVITSTTLIANQIPGYSQVSTIATKKIGYTPSIPPAPLVPVDEDSTTEDNQSYRYADNIPVNISMADGNITATSAGKVWTLRLRIFAALNIGFMINNLNLSPNAELYIFDEARTTLDSAITQSKFSYSSQIGIMPMKTNSIIIYIIERNNSGNLQSTFTIPNLQAGFQPVSDIGDYTGLVANEPSLNCDPTIMCQTGKLNSARAVARFFSNGFSCTGTLINNENNNGRAFFLTAFHCLDVGMNGLVDPHGHGNGVIDPSELAALASSVINFHFWVTTCNGATMNSGISFSGAVLRSAWAGSDVVLLELLNPPGIGDGVNYAGWSRQTYSPADYGSYIIHHPQTQDMRITNTRLVKTWIWNNMFWTAKYSSGTVDRGSSGSALFNENDQIVGQLRGGWSNCNYTDFGDRYGKFYKSWDNSSLQQWLSPGQGLTSTNTLSLNPVTINGLDVIDCSGSSFVYSVPNLVGCAYSWVVPTSLIITSGQGTASITVIRNPSSPPATGQISVTIIDSKGINRFVTTSKNFTVGAAPVIAGFTTFLNSCLGGSDWELGIQANIGNQNITQFLWTRDGNPIAGNGSSQTFYEFPATCMNIGVRGVNACGTGPESNQTFCPPCPSIKITASPNPAKNHLIVQVNKPQTQNENKTTAASVHLSLVQSGTGITLRNWVMSEQKEYHLNLTGIKSGSYKIIYKNGTDQTFVNVIID